MFSAEVCPNTPPGLESVAKEWSPVQASTTCGDESFSSPKKSFDDIKDAIMREIHDDIDWKIAGAIDSMRQNFQKALQCIHDKHVSDSASFESALDVQMQHQQTLVQDVAILRKQLDSTMQRSLLAQRRSSFAGTLSRGQLHSAPYLSNTLGTVQEKDDSSPEIESSSESLTDGHFQKGSATNCDHSAKEFESLFSDEDLSLQATFATADSSEYVASCKPLGSQKQEASILCDLLPALDSSLHGTLELPAGFIGQAVEPKPVGFVQIDPVPSRCVHLTIRRADGVPLGLDVLGHGRDRFLTVQAINPGGAAEAWNRQCENGLREIRSGDRIVAINEAQDANTMRREYNKKYLLKISLLRCPSAELRADAVEFCPSQVCHASLDSDSEISSS